MAQINQRSSDEIVCSLRLQEIEPYDDDEATQEEDNVEIQEASDTESSEEDLDPDIPDYNPTVEHDEDVPLWNISDEYHIEEAETSTSRKRRSTIDIHSAGSSASKRGRKETTVLGRSGYRWSLVVPGKRSRLRSSLTSHSPGIVGEARNAKSPLEAWFLLIPGEMLEKIVDYTNEEITRRLPTLPQTTYYRVTTRVELNAVLALLYLAGLQQGGKTSTKELWSKYFGMTIFRAVMTRQRFVFLLGCLRFDDKATREERRKEDKFAPIREIWNEFIANCRKYYTPGDNCTIDEQLLSFRGRCPFRMYMPNKPDKYGIKIVMMNDARTAYMIDAVPYVGKVRTEHLEAVPSYYIRTLSERIHNTNRNITCDNWFSSVECFDRMLKHFSITMVGTIRKNKKQIPPSFAKGQQVNTAQFAFDENKTLVAFTPKRNKVVLLLSTLHHDNAVDADTGKPNIVMFYNTTKGGTDLFDQLCRNYTTSRKTNRWPLRIFFGMLDHAGVNSMILHNFNRNNENLNRRIFLRSLAATLMEPYLRIRFSTPSLQVNIRMFIKGVLDIELPPSQSDRDNRLERRQRCAFCPRANDVKTRLACTACMRPICQVHRVELAVCPICQNYQ